MSNNPRDSLLEASPERLELRSYSGTLNAMGGAVIIFSIWSVIKTILSIIFMPQDLHDQIFNETPSDYLGILALIIAIPVTTTFLIRLYVGLSARAEAAGKKKSPIYLIFAGLLFIEYIFFFYIDISSIIQPDTEIVGDFTIDLSSIGGVFIDLTSLAILIAMIISAIHVRRLKKQLGEA